MKQVIKRFFEGIAARLKPLNLKYKNQQLMLGAALLTAMLFIPYMNCAPKLPVTGAMKTADSTSGGSNSDGSAAPPSAQAKLMLTGQNKIIYNNCVGPFEVKRYNSNGIQVPFSAATTVTLTAIGTATFFSDTNCTTAVTTLPILELELGRSFYVKTTAPLNISITASVPNHTDSTINANVFRFTKLSVGGGQACAIINGGAMCWGLGNRGQLGNNTVINSLVPSTVTGLTSGVTDISAGSDHGCAVHNGAAKCWGYNAFGQLGNNTKNDSRVPVQVSGLTAGVTAVFAGSKNSCALQNGALRCWGYNLFGQLGNGTTTESLVPAQVTIAANGITSVAIGGDHICAIQNAALFCWGINNQGQLGQPAVALQAETPVMVQGFDNGVTSVGAKEGKTCAVRNGAGFCWGNNREGTLGDGTLIDRAVPTMVAGFNAGVTNIKPSSIHSCGVINGGVRCWGNNNNGGLGRGDTVNSLVPVQVTGITAGASDVGAGDGLNFGCARIGGGVKCWGSNGQGSLGDGTGVPTRVPVEVIIP
jgi:alpha-tubulin suppressor-like RCC1 family protein